MTDTIDVISLGEQFTKSIVTILGDFIMSLIRLIKMKQFKTLLVACGLWVDAIIKGGSNG